VDDLMLFRQRLFDRNAALRRASAEALGRARDQDSILSIRKLAGSDSSAQVKLAAAFALHQLGEPQSHLIAAMLVSRDAAEQARDYLFEIGAPALPGVLETLKVATDSRHRADLVQLIGFLGNAETVPVLQPLLKDRDQRVVRAVSNAIARLTR
jgi:HEAT repeat protein